MTRGKHRHHRVGRLPRAVTVLILLAVLVAVVATFAPDSTPADAAGRPRDAGERHHHDRARTAATCTLTVPADPTSAAGLATPYVLHSGTDTCTEGSPDTSAFVEATIVDPATGALSAYRPLVVTAGHAPAVPPHVPVLPPGGVVGIWFGFQGDSLRLTGPGASSCTNGVGGDLFGQFAYCNALPFFRATRRVRPPALGVALDGLPCPTTRDFSVIDQDQSDNVSTQYVLLPAGVAPSTVASRLAGGVPIKNGSDNGLLNRSIQPALGCSTWTVPDLTDPDPAAPRIPTLAANELQAAAFQGPPVALVPRTDPMTGSTPKTVLYRLGVDQPVFGVSADTAAYCNNLMTVGWPRIQQDKPFTLNAGSPDQGVGLYDFLVGRFMATTQNLGCP